MTKNNIQQESKPPQIVEYRSPDGDRIRGFWTGVPEESAFIWTDVVRDKRGLADETKRRLLAENAAQEACRKSLRNPLPPSPRKPRQQRQTEPPAWGTLEYWRDRAMHAEDRVRGLEGDLASLSRQLDDWRAPMTYLVEAPSKNGRSKKEPAWHARFRGEAERLIAGGTPPRNVVGKLLNARFNKLRNGDVKHSEDAIRRVLKLKKPVL